MISFVVETALYIGCLFSLGSASNKTIRSLLLSLSIVKLLQARPLFFNWCLWCIFHIPSALRGQNGISLSLPALTLICALLLCFSRDLLPRISQYATTILMDFTEWHITFLCSLGHLLSTCCARWDYLPLYSSYVAILPATRIVLGWAIWCSRVTALPGISVRVSGSTFLSHCMMHATILLPLALELHLAIGLGSSVLMKFLSSVYGLCSYLVMIQCMFVLFRDSGPALLPSWFFERGTHVVPLACEFANSHSRELTMSSWAHRNRNTLSWLLSGLPFGTSWLLGVLAFQASLTLIPAQHQFRTEVSCMGNDLYSYTAILFACIVVNSLGVLVLPCFVTVNIY